MANGSSPTDAQARRPRMSDANGKRDRAAETPARHLGILPAADAAPATLIEAASAALRRDILQGTFPPGGNLRIELLKQRYAVSASTMREALTRLAPTGLVIPVGQRGFRVAAISLDDLNDITRMRKLLESLALRESIESGGDAWEAEILSTYYRLNRIEKRLGALEPAQAVPQEIAEEWEERNRAFHLALIGACSSHWLMYFHAILYGQSLRYRIQVLRDKSVPRNVEAEHTAIFDAVMARDADRACQLIEAHIEKTAEAIRGAGQFGAGTSNRSARTD
jgi:GntR family carbon starvation induced transcriptional regulator